MKLALEEMHRSLVFEHWSLRTWTPNSADQCPIYVQFVACHEQYPSHRRYLPIRRFGVEAGQRGQENVRVKK